MDPYQDDLDESDSFDRPRFDTDGTFTHANFQFERPHNRFGEERAHHDSFQDDQYRSDYDPTYEDQYGNKHPYEHGGVMNRWSDDFRSEASHENHYGKGPKGYQRSDKLIFEDACELLTRDSDLDASGIEVKVEKGQVFLKGEVGSRQDKFRAEELLERVSGAREIFNQLRVRGVFQETLPRGARPEGSVKGLV